MTLERRLIQCSRAIVVLATILFAGCGGGNTAKPPRNFPYWDGPGGTLCAKMAGGAYCFPKSTVLATNLPGEIVDMSIYAPDDSITDNNCNKERLKRIGDGGSNVHILIEELQPGDSMKLLAERLSQWQLREYGVTREMQGRMKNCVTFPEVRGRDTACTGVLEGRDDGADRIRYFAECHVPTEYVVNPDCDSQVIFNNLHVHFSVSRYCSASMREIAMNAANFIRRHKTGRQ